MATNAKAKSGAARGGSVTKKSASRGKPGAVRPAKKPKLIDPMLVSPVEAEKHNEVLDDALADLELAKEAAELGLDDFNEEMAEREELARERQTVAEAELADIMTITEEDEKLNRRRKKALKSERKKERKMKKEGKRKMKLWKKILIVLVLLLMAAGGYAAWYAFTALDKATVVFQGSPLDILTPTKLEQDENGLTNILIFGTSEDEEEHGGAMLADSILVVSFNQEKKLAKTFSIPRDLWVDYTVDGEDTLYCSVGYKGKINAEYYCALLEMDEDPKKASQYFARKVGEITGLNIQYFVAVDWTVLVTIVDTLGGIDVDVWSTDPAGISDICQQIVLPAGMNYNLIGDTVLRLARARGACYEGIGPVRANYGLANSNFDREKNQQRIINGIKNKALNVGILLDPTKVLTIIDSLGENVHTNISMSELRSVMDMATGMTTDIEPIETQDLFSTGMYGTQSIVIPRGANVDNAYTLYNYKRIQQYLAEELKSLWYEAPAETTKGAGTTAAPDATDETAPATDVTIWE